MFHARLPAFPGLCLSAVALLAAACGGDAPESKADDATTAEGGDDGGAGGTDGGDDAAGGDDGTGDDGSTWTAPEGGVVELVTEDDVTLVADYYPVDREGAAAVVLLHMIPPSWDRSSWPADFIAALNAEGWAVLVPDRRGAGDSEGAAMQAYTGPNGKYDAAACVDRLRADGYDDFAIIGASNGTTTALDYTLWATAEGRPTPAALGFMTGGTYTETNADMDALSGAVPAVFTYSTDERSWSVAQQAYGHAAWTFHEYGGGDHGTLMFAAAPEVTADLVAFLAGAF